jgi:hypothetical protein
MAKPLRALIIKIRHNHGKIIINESGQHDSLLSFDEDRDDQDEDDDDSYEEVEDDEDEDAEDELKDEEGNLKVTTAGIPMAILNDPGSDKLLRTALDYLGSSSTCFSGWSGTLDQDGYEYVVDLVAKLTKHVAERANICADDCIADLGRRMMVLENLGKTNGHGNGHGNGNGHSTS